MIVDFSDKRQLLRIVYSLNLTLEEKTELKDSIKKHNSLELFPTNVTTQSAFINKIFVWRRTRKSHSYWKGIYIKLQGIPLVLKSKRIEDL